MTSTRNNYERVIGIIMSSGADEDNVVEFGPREKLSAIKFKNTIFHGVDVNITRNLQFYIIKTYNKI